MEKMQHHEQYFQEAVALAQHSRCSRGRGGSVVVLVGEVIGRGYNAPPQDNHEYSMCHTDYRVSSKPKSDRTCCVHAEWRAILDAVKKTGDITGSSLYYASIDEQGVLIKSGQPYCTVCSRLALDVGITFFGLWQKEGMRLFDTREYNTLSYDFHKEA